MIITLTFDEQEIAFHGAEYLHSKQSEIIESLANKLRGERQIGDESNPAAYEYIGEPKKLMFIINEYNVRIPELP